MKKLFCLIIFIFLSFNLNAEENAYLPQCHNYGPGVSYFYQSCVNNNFATIAKRTRAYYQQCVNYTPEVDYFFNNCVNNNFRETQWRLGNRVWLDECPNYDRSTLDFFFQNCVNSNYMKIQRVIGNTLVF